LVSGAVVGRLAASRGLTVAVASDRIRRGARIGEVRVITVNRGVQRIDDLPRISVALLKTWVAPA